MDAELLGSEVEPVVEAINDHTEFEAHRETGMRVDVHRSVDTGSDQTANTDMSDTGTNTDK